MQRLNTAMDAETFAAAAAAQRPLIETAETAKAGLGVMTEARWSTLASQLADLGVVAKALPASEYFTVVVAP
jgi:NitT/TauT family transport system substrate-binding protein